MNLTNEEIIKILDVTPVRFNEDIYITVKDFCKVTGKLQASILMMISKGNQIRKLESFRLSGKNLIPLREVFDYPFAKRGRVNEDGVNVTRYYILEGCLTTREELYKV